MHLRRSAIALIALLLVGTPALAAPQEGDLVVILVRHAETEFPDDAEDPRNPFLREVGLAQAARLAELLAPAGLDRVYSTEYHRTWSTATPSADATGLEVQPYDPSDLLGFAEELKGMQGRILVVGHSNTTPMLVEALGGDPGEPIDEKTEFNRLYTLTWRSEGLTTEMTHYGESLEHR